MNLKEIKEIIKLMNENDLGEIEVEREGSKLKVKRSSSGSDETVYHPMPQRSIEPVSALQSSSAPAASTPSVIDAHLKQITSPMIGTFYRAPSPEAPPFVEVGQIVEVGQVVCIVEAMKLMNEIKSEVRGKVTQSLVNNAEPVEFGQPLFAVEPV
ncbi:MAG: acetyl-CoA carboxylase biotin carboxyl carrier protein [Candidatus Omnitrophica bacterium]|nr:acetyl-CoA carboxylase biotin carboxyl carrier protein [Candidatus Omnitrophota bacterium]